MEMTPERWRQIKELLDRTEEQDPARRRAWLADACGSDRELLAELESLLEHEDELDSFIDEPLIEAISRNIEIGSLSPGDRVGPYRLVRLLGKGGMGAVYLASREEDFEQRVALKLLPPGLASAEAIRRFAVERQILARLEHPNIARLLGGGTATGGLPYFAMEVIEGQPLDRYCDEQRLGVRERIEIFLAICSALQLAHQSLVIHRDLKPANILVDGAGVPKLLDFGIAKQLETAAEPAAGAAAPTEQLFTLYYASPEQIKGEPVGTATDVYSLGVVMYQVLTGRLPGDLEELGHFDRLRAICDEDPLPVSAAFVFGADPEGLAWKRGTDYKGLRQQLAGDLDAIVAKALRKEPAERYPTADKLADDLRRHLGNLPVLARQGNFAYRAGKFLRRRRLVLAAAAAVLLVALAFTGALQRELSRTEAARDRAEGVSAFLIDLFQAASPDRPAGEEPTLRQLLERGRRQLESGLEQDPLQRATLQLKLGEVYYKLGDHVAAEVLYVDAIAIWRRQGDDPDLASAINNLAMVYYKREDYPRAEVLLRECVAMRRRLGREEDLLKPQGNLAAILLARGELAEAEEIHRENLAIRRATLPPRHQNLAASLRSLGVVLTERGRPAEAEPLLREALSIRQEFHGPKSVPVAAVLTSLARVAEKLGRSEEARLQVEEALAIYREELGEDNAETVRAKKQLAELVAAPPWP